MHLSNGVLLTGYRTRATKVLLTEPTSTGPHSPDSLSIPLWKISLFYSVILTTGLRLNMENFDPPSIFKKTCRSKISPESDKTNTVSLKSSLGKLREVSQIKRAVNLNPGYSLGNNPISDSRACWTDHFSLQSRSPVKERWGEHRKSTRTQGSNFQNRIQQ